MCFPLPADRVLAKGTHAGHEWVVTHNGRGYRCGYVKVLPGHPWHGQDYNSIDCDVHGGLTFGEKDEPCGKGEDDGYWIGFDCGHYGDEPDPSLPNSSANKYGADPVLHSFFEFSDSLCAKPIAALPGVRTQEYVEEQCRSLCEQANKATLVGLKGQTDVLSHQWSLSLIFVSWKCSFMGTDSQ